MTSRPEAKRIKLSLEPFIDNKTVDITNTGHEILKTEVPLAEKTMQNVDRIWFERGEWKDITEQSLKESIAKGNERVEEKKEQKESAEQQQLQLQQQQQGQMAPPGMDIVKLRESVINKLFHAKSEIDVALDVINILLASHHASTAKDLVLPAGSLSATYVTKPKPTLKAELEAVQLNLGLKRKQQRQASEYLKKSASALKSIIEREHEFWDEALNVRRHNWIMYANTNQMNGSFLIQYGFAEAGSDFNEASLGELKRADDGIQLSVAHVQARRVAVRLRHADTLLGMTDDSKKEDEGYAEPEPKNIQDRLVQANSTVFDAELFSNILAEAQTLNSNVHIGNDQVEINIDGDIDLSISKLPITNAETPPKERAITNRMIDLSLRLLLLQRHNYNIWKTKAKILSPNPIVQQSLSKKSDTNSAANAMATSHHHHHTVIPRAQTRVDLPKTVPILFPIISITKFWVQFDRIRQVVHSILYPFRRLGFSVHFKVCSDDKVKSLYPSYGTVALYFDIGLHKGPHLRFMLNQQTGAISALLPQTTVVLQQASELRVFLSREINVMCLETICNVANDIIRLHPNYQARMFLWKLDRIDESIHGSLCTKDGQWQHIHTQIHHDANMSSFHINFHVTSVKEQDEKLYSIENIQEYSALTFKERVTRIVEKIIADCCNE
ncbi:RNA polymerase II mediator complex subunit [Rhizopus azygosporus]|uniref:Mediator of RNA polymerase II transcription subunit 17 n=1 Tax=Rhizopus azygosporus TaxID=86630 RepID=A0A367KAV6_RHIAZ|nr:RNA polymerase II mediator complex subunit [Rhizopus azygosporus]